MSALPIHNPQSAIRDSVIHPTAIIAPTARIGDGCHIGPYCVIEDHAVVGDRCRLRSHVVIGGHTVLGVENDIFPFACIGQMTQDLKWKGGTTWLRIGDYNTFREYVTIHRATGDGDATIVGSHNNLLAYTHVAHDCRLGDHIIMSNVATLAGHVTVGDHAVIGGLAAVHQFCRIGKMAIIGGCSKVVQDVPPFMLADGNPAETRTVNKVGLDRNGVGAEAQDALKKAFKILFRNGLTVANALAKITTDVPQLAEVLHLVDFVRSSERGISK